MINLFKRFSILLILLFCFVYPWKISNAQEPDENFYINSEVVYQVDSNTKTRVTQDISIINRKEFVYSPSYSITLHLKNISDIVVHGRSGDIPFTLQESEGDKKTIDIKFPEKVVGVGKENRFTISFLSTDFAHLVGSILTVSVPSLSGNKAFNKYSVRVAVPPEYSSPSLVKPSVSYEKGGSFYTFSDAAELKNGIELVFGKQQLYEFKLSYHLENSNLFPIKTEIALPPNTAYQEVMVENMDPKPENTYKDKDGNILSVYTIPPKTTINTKADVLVMVTSTPKNIELSEKDRRIYLRSQKYWEVNDPEIKKLAKSLKTAENIYAYVVKSLSYDTTKTQEKNVRLGAKETLSKPYFAVCLEFTDLFVALSRAAGIPARAVEGYAYTNDSEEKPVSLFQDILHSWPEYYDDQKKTWVMVDPTWGNTTRGMDYFNSIDFNHVAFSINGEQSTYPIPAGGYKGAENSKDILVTFPKYSFFQRRKNIKIGTSYSSFVHNNEISGKITLFNNGNFELANQSVKIYIDGNFSQELVFPKTPPFGRSTLSVAIKIPHGKSLLSLTNITHKVTIQDKNNRDLARSDIRVFPFSEIFIIGGAAFVGILFVLILAFKTRSISI